MVVLLFVALWFSLRGDLFCLTLCYFVLVFISPFSIAITSLGEERANLSAFRTFFRFVLVWFCLFPLPLGVWEGLRFVVVALPGLFSYLLFYMYIYITGRIVRTDFIMFAVCDKGKQGDILDSSSWRIHLGELIYSQGRQSCQIIMTPTSPCQNGIYFKRKEVACKEANSFLLE